MQRTVLLTLLAAFVLAALPAPAAQPADRGPILKRAPGPDYPDAARPFSPANAIVAGIRIGRNGHVDDVYILDSEHTGMGFEDAAIDAVRRWRFQPSIRDGRKVSSFHVVRLQFLPPAGSPSRRPTLQGCVLGIGEGCSGRPVPHWSLGPGPLQSSLTGPTNPWLPWDYSWESREAVLLAFLAVYVPELNSSLVGWRSQSALIQYGNADPEDTAGVEATGFLFSSWQRYQDGLDVNPIQVPGLPGVTKSRPAVYAASGRNLEIRPTDRFDTWGRPTGRRADLQSAAAATRRNGMTAARVSPGPFRSGPMASGVTATRTMSTRSAPPSRETRTETRTERRR